MGKVTHHDNEGQKCIQIAEHLAALAAANERADMERKLTQSSEQENDRLRGERDSARQRIALLTAENAKERSRRFLRCENKWSSHTTACSIWGDDGQGHTRENFPEPLPCNCGALENFQRQRADKAEAENERLKAPVSDEEIMKAIYLVANETVQRMLTITLWKDGIDIEEPSHAARRFAAYLIAARAEGKKEGD